MNFKPSLNSSACGTPCITRKFNTAKQNESSEDFKFHFKNRYLAMISKADEILF